MNRQQLQQLQSMAITALFALIGFALLLAALTWVLIPHVLLPLTLITPLWAIILILIVAFVVAFVAGYYLIRHEVRRNRDVWHRHAEEMAHRAQMEVQEGHLYTEE